MPNIQIPPLTITPFENRTLGLFFNRVWEIYLTQIGKNSNNHEARIAELEALTFFMGT